jgi:hypothetical protein
MLKRKLFVVSILVIALGSVLAGCGKEMRAKLVGSKEISAQLVTPLSVASVLFNKSNGTLVFAANPSPDVKFQVTLCNGGFDATCSLIDEIVCDGSTAFCTASAGSVAIQDGIGTGGAFIFVSHCSDPTIFSRDDVSISVQAVSARDNTTGPEVAGAPDSIVDPGNMCADRTLPN